MLVFYVRVTLVCVCQAEHEKDVEVIRSHSASLEQEVDALVARKEELKQDLCDTKDRKSVV